MVATLKNVFHWDEVERIVVNTGTSEVIKAAAAGKKHVLIGFEGNATAADTFTFRSGTTAISGGFDLAINARLSLPIFQAGWCQTAAGESLNILPAATGEIGGIALVITVDTE